jgi:mRNA-degrading endonuclease YafQ of YafQ-DinJ toxin-antitoxin module
MYKIIVSQKFKRSYKNFVSRFPYLQENIDNAIKELSIDPYSPLISSHKLSGDLFELYGCKCGYDCRIIFSIEKIKEEKDKYILLVDIGNHDDVY